ncbi:MAG TPA: gamma-glutamylcyclotransferase [Acidimicrobiales bacterium]|nr:gamma-glutamylcyclotransferase [Acidimicrobiales bacterium]
MDHVFVYGTLMPGQPLWPALAPYAVSWHAATAGGRIWDTGRGYPAVQFDAGGQPVPGVVVVLDPARLVEAVALLDEIEEEGSLYRRVEVATSAGPAFAYEWLGPVDGLRLLPAGWPVSGRGRAGPPSTP